MSKNLNLVLLILMKYSVIIAIILLIVFVRSTGAQVQFCTFVWSITTAKGWRFILKFDLQSVDMIQTFGKNVMQFVVILDRWSHQNYKIILFLSAVLNFDAKRQCCSFVTVRLTLWCFQVVEISFVKLTFFLESVLLCCICQYIIFMMETI